MKQSFVRSMMIVVAIALVIVGVSSCHDNNPVTPDPVKPEPEQPEPEQPEPETPKDTTLAVVSISPIIVNYGDTIIMKGKNFSTTPANDKVTINDSPATVISANDSILKVVVPVLTHTSNELKLQVGTSTVTGGTITYEPTVFVAGALYKNLSSATYWKNGTAVTVDENESLLNAISVNETGVYVGGWERTNNLQLANYWKDGIKTTLGTGQSAVYAMAVNGTDVYTGGFEIINGFDIPRYWNNTTGISVEVRDPIIDKVVLGNGSCGGIYFANNTVYAVGTYRNTQGRFAPWETKNDVIPANTIPNNDKHAFANGVFVDGSVEYVVGTQNNPVSGLAMPTLWTNGEPTILTTASELNSIGIARAVVVVGGDVYVAGYEQENYSGGGKTFAKYWKNGVPVKLSNENSNAISIAIFDGDVYVAGWEHDGDNDVAKYWKNGVAVSLTNGVHPSVGNAIVLR